MFGKYLQPLERTDIILTAIEAMTDASISDKEGASSMLDEAMKDPNFWLTDVSGLWLDCPAHEPFQGLFFPPSIPSSLPAGLRRDEARGRPPEQEPVHTSRFQPQDVSPLNSLTAKAFILEKTDLHPQLVLPCHQDFHTSG